MFQSILLDQYDKDLIEPVTVMFPVFLFLFIGRNLTAAAFGTGFIFGAERFSEHSCHIQNRYYENYGDKYILNDCPEHFVKLEIKKLSLSYISLFQKLIGNKGCNIRHSGHENNLDECPFPRIRFSFHNSYGSHALHSKRVKQ